MTQSTTTKAILLTSTLIPALMSLTSPGNSGTPDSGERMLLAQQQQEPAEKSDRPDRRRPEGVPGKQPGGRPPQGQAPAKESAPPPPQPPAAQERREPPKGPVQAQPPAPRPDAPPTPRGVQEPPPAKQAPPKAATPPAPPPPAQQTPQPNQAQPPAPSSPAPLAPPAGQGLPRPSQAPAPTQLPAATPAQPGPAQPPAPQGRGQPPAMLGSAPPAAAQQSLPPPTTPGGAIAVQPTGSQGQPLQRVDQLRGERREITEGGRTVIREPDRTIIREGGRTIIRHNEVDRFRVNARDVRSERQGNETVTVIERSDGTRVVTVVDDEGRLVRRSRRGPDGREVVIIDNRHRGPANSQTYYVDLPPPVVRIPRERYILETERASRRDIYEVLIAPPVERIDRRYTLDEIRYSPRVRERMSRVDIDTINFESGSWAIAPDQVDRLSVIAEAVQQAIGQNPAEVFLVEGHTDAVGPDVDNLSLSDRRAETVAVTLSQRFGVPAENLTTQGYGEQYLKVPTDGPERQNRRVTLRRITPLLTGQN